MKDIQESTELESVFDYVFGESVAETLVRWSEGLKELEKRVRILEQKQKE